MPTCRNCCYDLTDLTTPLKCPECGIDQPQSPALSPTEARVIALAKRSLLTFVTLFIAALLCSIAGNISSLSFSTREALRSTATAVLWIWIAAAAAVFAAGLLVDGLTNRKRLAWCCYLTTLSPIPLILVLAALTLLLER